ncbi:MAG: hypothetical protein K2P81_17335, partial [Bacteriovoracaceae bacterium]|nr:hypothetical protein [Bacteriovoracaceae bacterium]
KKSDPRLSVTFDVILYSGVESELTSRLNNLAKKKELEEKKREQVSAQLWRDVEEKLRTLSAISSQVEQNFQGLLDRRMAWPARLKKVIDAYTMKFGGFLTNFIIQNDEDFNKIATQDVIGKIDIMGRQPLINAHAKRIGFISMKFIEKLQSSKEAPNRKDLVEWMKVVTQDFGVERESLRIAVLEAQMFSKQTSQSPAP